MSRASDLRPPEWLLIAYFSYAALAASWLFASFLASWKEWVLAGAVVLSICILRAWTSRSGTEPERLRSEARGGSDATSSVVLLKFPRSAGSLVRDFAPLAFTLAAYREMNWFTPAARDHHLEHAWIVWDRWLLYQAGLRSSIESMGVLLPACLELSYLLVYAVAPVSLVLLFLNGKRDSVSRFWLAYLAGTLGAYALFPYFPSEPPRTVFSGVDLPRVATMVRQWNLWILSGYGIHSSVFPSAHVSSAFSAAWALRATIPERTWIGWLMAVYAVSVAIATIYGRYHYATDVLAGFAISLVAWPCLYLTAPAEK